MTMLTKQHGLTEKNWGDIQDTLKLSREKIDDMSIVRVSEKCELRAHKYVNLHEMHDYDRVIKLLEPGETESVSSNRMRMGNLLEPMVIGIACKRLVKPVMCQQQLVWHYYPDWNALMTGHIDGIIESNGRNMVFEVKTTSDDNYWEVVNAVESFDGHSDSLYEYCVQMRRYAAMLYNNTTIQNFTPMFGMLALLNRNSGDVFLEEIPLFEEEEDPNTDFLNKEIRSAFGYRHPKRHLMTRRPSDKYSSHPVCVPCFFRSECYTKSYKEEGIDEKEKAQIRRDYADADRFLKSGNAIKKRVKRKVTELMDTHGINKIDLLEGSSVTRYSQSSKRGKTDYDKMQQDGVYDTYVTEGKPYDVVRFNIKR